MCEDLDRRHGGHEAVAEAGVVGESVVPFPPDVPKEVAKRFVDQSFAKSSVFCSEVFFVVSARVLFRRCQIIIINN